MATPGRIVIEEKHRTVTGMERDILIVRDGDRYRLLHCQLHLAAALSGSDEVRVEIKEEGEVRIIKARGGLLVEKDDRRLPLFRNN